jgi:DNA-binding MarR family transcriptional regulator
MPEDVTTLPTLPCACASLRRAARAVSHLYDEELRATGLRATQFTLLQVLSRTRGRAMTQSDLADVLAIDTTTLSRTLQPLERAGWIRAESGEDKRALHWTITRAGERRLASTLPAWEAAQRRLRNRLGAERFQGMLAELASVAQVTRSEERIPRIQ